MSTIIQEKVRNNEILVSFDVESLFHQRAAQAALRKLENAPDLANRSTLSPEQQSGAQSVWLIMNEFEEQAIATALCKPKI